MKKQFCIVTNKNQLLAAIDCAIGYYNKTEIILNRKKGITTIILEPKLKPEDFRFNIYPWSYQNNFDSAIKKYKSRIRKTPAECFK